MNTNDLKYSSKIIIILLIFFSIISICPLFWLILSSLKTQEEMVSYPPVFLPEKLKFENYKTALVKIEYFRYLLNTLLLSLIYTIPGTISAAIFGYAFARFNVYGRDFLFNIVMILLLIPPVSVLLPEYLFFVKFNLIGSYKIWLLWGIGGNPLFIYLFKQFFSYFPVDLEEAAILDGCTEYGVLFKIFLPMSKSVIVTVFILSFLIVYGDFMGPAIFLSGIRTTLPVAMTTGYVIRNGILLVPVLLAGIVLYSIPVILIFIVGQKYYVRGLISSSGTKD